MKREIQSDKQDFFNKLRNPEVGVLDLVEMLATDKSLIFAKDERGNTAFHYAAASPNPDKMKYICGDRVDVESVVGGIPTVVSVRIPSLGLVDINVLNNSGKTPLDIAVRRGNVDVAHFIREKNLISAIEEIAIPDNRSTKKVATLPPLSEKKAWSSQSSDVDEVKMEEEGLKSSGLSIELPPISSYKSAAPIITKRKSLKGSGKLFAEIAKEADSATRK